ncbi:MAG: Non-heme chloroperoxidase [Candidatus Heimdallarchaeota archaeon AB_125]|nr:MAG: Non-heme chloroperoxidase [Candidatus Heimdallarchaeota archaeon AB_125]
MKTDSENLGKTMTLSDGRKLGYIERGTSKDETVFYLHGWPSSRLELLEVTSFITISGYRLISIDRPGIGLSDFKKKRTLLDIADDVVELADFLDIKKFSVLGLSGGAPYAHACAFKIPDRLNSVGIVSGLGPLYITKKHMSGPEGFMLTLGKTAPWLLRIFINAALAKPLKSKNQDKAKEKFLAVNLKNAPEPERKRLEHPGVFDAIWKQMQEAFIQGTKGSTKDVSLYTKHWGFELKDIPDKVKYFLWHGELDNLAPVGIGKAVAEEIHHCVSKYYPEEGHSSILFNNFEEIINTLLTA